MSVIGSNILAGASGQAGYFLTNSLRFRASASAYLNRTGGTSTNRKIHTFSFWTKYSVTGGTRVIASAGSDDNNREWVGFDSNNFYYQVKDSGNFYELGTTQVLRDPSAWYHLMVAVDTTQATSSNRVKMYINGVQVTAFGTATYPLQNDDLFFNDSVGGVSYIGALRGFVGSTGQYDGYLAEFNFIDGQQLTPSSFGQTSTSTGVWQPIKYTGTYGTNGIYLPFTDNSALTTSSNIGLGKDFSGNANYWTTNNISITSGSTYDSMTDVPTLTSATAGNFAVLNPLDVTNTGTRTIQAGNLDINTSSGAGGARSTFQLPTTGKWYFEGQYVSGTWTGNKGFGIGTSTADISGAVVPTGCVTYNVNGNKTTGGAYSAYGSSYTTTNTVGVAVDQDAGTVTFYKDTTSQGAITHGLSTSDLFALFVDPSAVASVQALNFGQRPFAQTIPSGFKALNTFNLPTPTIGATAATTANKYMDATLYTGNGTSQSIVNSGSMQPDLVWEKRRDAAQTFSNGIIDSVRGRAYSLVTNLTIADQTSTSTNDLTSFNSNGFSIGPSSNLSINDNGGTYVAWQWRASNTTAVSNTAGSITSTVSANTSAGFSIVTYTGNATSSQTVGHGLGVTPTFFILKSRGVQVWNVYSLAGGITGNTILQLNDSSGAVTGSNISLTASSTTIGFGSAAQVNGSAVNFVAYVFAPIAGYSAFGSYTGNGSSDGPFIYTGFRPRWLMIKNSSTTVDWVIEDTSRDPYNVAGAELFPNLSNAESAGNADLDILSNGFKPRRNSTFANGSGNTIIYMAFAESPFKYANAR